MLRKIRMKILKFSLLEFSDGFSNFEFLVVSRVVSFSVSEMKHKCSNNFKTLLKNLPSLNEFEYFNREHIDNYRRYFLNSIEIF